MNILADQIKILEEKNYGCTKRFVEIVLSYIRMVNWKTFQKFDLMRKGII